MYCLKCGNEFQGKKTNAKFCSDSCRAAYNTSMRRDNLSGAPEEEKGMAVHIPTVLGNPSMGNDFMLNFLNSEKAKVERENETLKAEIKALEKENKDLTIYKNTEEKRKELDIEKAQYDKTKGLSGFMESPIADRLLSLGETWLEKKFTEGSDTGILGDLDGDEKELMTTIVNAIKNQDTEFLAHLLTAILHFNEHPERLKNVVTMIQRIDAGLTGDHEDNEEPPKVVNEKPFIP